MKGIDCEVMAGNEIFGGKLAVVCTEVECCKHETYVS